MVKEIKILLKENATSQKTLIDKWESIDNENKGALEESYESF